MARRRISASQVPDHEVHRGFVARAQPHYAGQGIVGIASLDIHLDAGRSEAFPVRLRQTARRRDEKVDVAG